MKFIVVRTSDYYEKNKEEIEINTLQELMNWIDEQEHEIIVSGNELEIYDDYRE